MLPAAILVISHSKFPVWAIVGIVAGIYGFARGFRLLQRKRLILNTPASKIRSASMGLVEISGLAIGPHVILSPLKQIQCYYYRTLAWELKQRGKNSEWVKVADETLHVPFYVDDNTDKLLIDPTGAEMDVHCDFHEEYHESLFFGSDVPEAVSGFLTRHAVTPRGKIKVEEYCIKPENFLFVLGTLSQNPGLDASVTPAWAVRTGQSLQANRIPAEKGAEAEPLQRIIRLSAGAAPVPATQMTQQQKIAAALAKARVMDWAGGESKSQGALPVLSLEPAKSSDAPAGSVSPAPRGNGADAPQNAGLPSLTPAIAHSAPSVALVDQKRGPYDASGFDLHPPVILMKGSNEPTFFISWRSQRDVVKTLNWKSTLLIWGCPALVLGCVYVLILYFR